MLINHIQPAACHESAQAASREVHLMIGVVQHVAPTDRLGNFAHTNHKRSSRELNVGGLHDDQTTGAEVTQGALQQTTGVMHMLNHVPQCEQVNGAIWNLRRQVINVVGRQATPFRSFNGAGVDIGTDCSLNVPYKPR